MPNRISVIAGSLLLTLPLQSAFAKEDAYVEGEVLVLYKSTVAEEGAKASLGRHSLQWAQHFDAISRQRGRHSGLVRKSGATTAALIAELKNDSDVEAVEPNYIRHVSAVSAPSDAGFSKLWGLNNTGQTANGDAGTSGVDINFLNAWKLSNPNAPEVVVGIVDTGVDITHPDLAANIWTNPKEIAGNGTDDDGNGYVDDVHGYDFVGATANMTDSGYHGTHVAGTIAAIGKNGIGVIGVDYQAKILPLKVSSDGDSINSSAEIAALNYAVKLKQAGVNIVAINASFGGGSSTTSEKNAISALNTAGIILCAAAGNDGANNDTTASYPANYDLPNIISVAAIDQNGNLPSWSNYGSKTVDIAAPGVNIYSTEPVSLATSTSAGITVGSTTYAGLQIEFSGMTPATGLNKTIYNCGLGNASEFPAGVSGNLALIQRGSINFSAKVANAMSAGAVGVIIYDNTTASLGGSGNSWTLGTSGTWIPALQVTQATGTAILAKLPTTGTLSIYADTSNAYQFLDGTSMATPHVSGAVAFAAMNYPNDTVVQRVARILNHATPETALSGKVITGGRLNLLGIVDTDSDGLPDWWETAHFGNLSQTGTGDYDNDGDSNLDEFLDGTDPASASDHLVFSGEQYVTADSGAGEFILSFATAVDRTYTVQYSDDLSGTWTTLGAAAAGTGSVVQVTDPTDPATHPQRFYRLHVE